MYAVILFLKYTHTKRFLHASLCVTACVQTVILLSACVKTYGESVCVGVERQCVCGRRESGKVVAVGREDSGCTPIGGTLPFCDWLW